MTQFISQSNGGDDRPLRRGTFSSVRMPSACFALQTPGSDSVLAVMETLVSVAGRELRRAVGRDGRLTDQSRHLVRLLCSLQTSLLSCCHRLVHVDPAADPPGGGGGGGGAARDERRAFARQAELILVKCERRPAPSSLFLF